MIISSKTLTSLKPKEDKPVSHLCREHKTNTYGCILKNL